METAKIINIPEPMEYALGKVTSNFIDAFYNLCEPEDANDFILVKLLTICSALLVDKKIPLYAPEKKHIKTMKSLESICYDDETTDKYDEAQSSVLYDYFYYCRNLLSCLTSFGWELVESHSDFFTSRTEPYTPEDVLGIERLAAYPDFLDVKKEIIKKAPFDIDRELHIFTNKRLGNYMSYSMKHPVDRELDMKINETLSDIAGVWGVDNVIHSNKPDGYEIAYVLITECGSYPSEDQEAFGNIGLFLPIHAANLEKLLDIAFERYPIEK